MVPSRATCTMKTTFCILANLVSIALTGANVQEFRKSALSSVHILYGASEDEVSAEFINYKLQLELDDLINSGGDMILLKSMSIPNQETGYDDDKCGQYHGIVIGNDRERKITHCRINRFGFKIYKSENDAVTNVEIIMLLRHPNSRSGLLVDVPIFKKPITLFKRPFKDDDDYRNWAQSAGVGVDSPVTVEQLDDILEGKPITIKNFRWLSNYRTGPLDYQGNMAEPADPLTDVFIARPLLLPDDIIDKIIEVTKYLLEVKPQV